MLKTSLHVKAGVASTETGQTKKSSETWPSVSIKQSHQTRIKVMMKASQICKSVIKTQKDIESHKKESEEIQVQSEAVHTQEIQNLNKLIVSLEKEINSKAEKFKSSEKARESLQNELKAEKHRHEQKI